jgi:metal-dependent amidase/aminoacylase/carboxypeptidase family protein
VITDRVTVDMLVRGVSPLDIADAESRVDRSLRAGALALGASVRITTLPGYRPLAVDRELGAVFRGNAVALTGDGQWSEDAVSTASTDAGDLSALMPVLHPTHGGCRGANHSAAFHIVDPEIAYVLPAKALAWTVLDLLAEGSPTSAGDRMTRHDYVARMRSATRTETFPQL